MKLLLDTHAFLWHANDDPRMSPKAAALLNDYHPRSSPATFGSRGRCGFRFLRRHSAMVTSEEGNGARDGTS